MPSRLSDAFRPHPIHDFTSLRELPDSYAWNQRDDGGYPSAAGEAFATESVPVVDLDDPNALQSIGHACRTWGVFQVTNHGIPTSLLDMVECTCRTLFSLPLHQKLKAARSPDGVSGYGFARISSFFSKLMWSEGFTVVGPPDEHFRQLWPHGYSNHCDVIKEYNEEMKKLAGTLMRLMLGSLGIVAKQDIKWAGPKGDFKEASAALQLNHYPACPDPDRAMGLAAHTDSTLLTILFQNNTSGLQVFKEGVGWVTVPPVPGRLVINVGDLMHILSNGSYDSILHRAMVNRTRHRLSLAYLYGPPSSVEISPHPKLVGPNHPPLYRPVTWNEYLHTKAKHFNEALSSVRVCVPLNGLIDVNEHNNSVTVG
ncbi:Gibberellin 3-beta-dioxygenase 1 [Hibiscus syriacus]|uniref:gibberellin 3beta-dioxygenase n=1 Tax=Hibiscus syriacus TaxID=106335 RepID=A0A6A2ZXF3_HIBSY|nr:gibberellin 3-beta-dioxygenase 1-like [Hibiscus syriacus]KAE8696097.1 Gibberellin 3-beta-dioxygenase 1 [Hibiscus syriacus]